MLDQQLVTSHNLVFEASPETRRYLQMCRSWWDMKPYGGKSKSAVMKMFLMEFMQESRRFRIKQQILKSTKSIWLSCLFPSLLFPLLFSVSPDVVVLVGATLNCLCTVSPVLKLVSLVTEVNMTTPSLVSSCVQAPLLPPKSLKSWAEIIIINND